MEDLISWIETFKLSHPVRKNLGRIFSDGVLLAEILKQLYPKLIDLHNYQPRCGATLKLVNWSTLNRKVFSKMGIPKSVDFLNRLCKCESGAIESLLWEIKHKYDNDKRGSSISLAASSYGDNNTEIMLINVQQKNGEISPQKMILYAKFEEAQITIREQADAITILAQKIEHLDNLLKLKLNRIQDLSFKLKKCQRNTAVFAASVDNENIETDSSRDI